MKKYISAILVPCLLMQLFGCYAFRELTIEELKNYRGSDDIRISTEGIEVLIKKDSTENHRVTLVISDSSIIVQEKTISRFSDNENLFDKKNEIKFNQIKSITVKESDPGNTIVLILLIVTVIGVTAYFVSQEFQSGYLY